MAKKENKACGIKIYHLNESANEERDALQRDALENKQVSLPTTRKSIFKKKNQVSYERFYFTHYIV